MAQAARDLAALESARARFGVELRHWRTLRGLSQRQLGELTHDSGAQVGKVEKAERWPTVEFARRMDAALETGGALEAMWPAVEAERDQPPEPAAGAGLGELVAADLGLRWSPTVASTIETAVQLWRADMERRTLITGAAWAAAVASPAQRWLRDPTDADVSHSGRRRVGRSDIDAMWAMHAVFVATERSLGGGYARSTLVQFLDQVVRPLLEGSYDDLTGRRLHAAAARLGHTCAFMSFDSGRYGLAQRHFTQALRQAKAAGDRASGAHILADMSMPALHLGHTREAIALAEAAGRTARGCGAPSIVSRCHALTARAQAAAGDATACRRHMHAAEKALERANQDDEPNWMRFFTRTQLDADLMYASSSLGDHSEVRRLAPDVLRDSAGMVRRRVLAGTTLAASYVDDDVDQACAVLRETLPAASGLNSSLGLDAINGVRRRLAPHRDRPSVQQVEEELRHLVGTTG